MYMYAGMLYSVALQETLTVVCLALQLEQMDVEIHDMPQAVRPQMKQRVESYRKELNRLKKEFVSNLSCLYELSCGLPSHWHGVS